MTTPVTAAPPQQATEATPVALQPVVEELTPTTLERCDGCGPVAQAIYRIILPGGGELVLCAHHAKKGRFVSLDAKSYLDSENRKQGSAN